MKTAPRSPARAPLRRLSRAVCSLALVPFAMGCGGSGPTGPSDGGDAGCMPTTRVCSTGTDTTHYAPGLEPLGDDSAAAPAQTPTDAYPETLSLVGGHTAAYDWAEGRGYVHAGISDVWTALQDPDVGADRRRVSVWTAMPVADPQYRVNYVVHTTVHAIVTVDYDITWGQDVGEGTPDAPTVVSARWTKTAGSTLLQLVQGSVVLRAVDAQTTAVEFIEQEKAATQGQSDIEQFLQDFFASLVAKVHGQPLPTY